MTAHSADTLYVDSAQQRLTLGDLGFPCVLGRSGIIDAADKSEGDGATPRGQYRLKAALFRPGRAAPPAGMALPWRWTHASDGWSDDPRDPAYNRPVRLPHAFSAETLQRNDMLYDVVLIIGHNDAPPVPGMGSAIFLHLWDEAKAPTERTTQGCVAVSRAAMDALLPLLRPETTLVID